MICNFTFSQHKFQEYHTSPYILTDLAIEKPLGPYHIGKASSEFFPILASFYLTVMRFARVGNSERSEAPDRNRKLPQRPNKIAGLS